MTKTGARLRVGDAIEVWWKPHFDIIISLKPYQGPLAHLFPQGAQLAEFAILRSGMTIDNSELYTLVNRAIRERNLNANAGKLR